MALTLRAAARSDVGLVRTNNEDAAYVGPRLLVVADGMGGHAAGEIASSTVVAALAPARRGGAWPRPRRQPAQRRITAANERLRLAVDSSEQLEGMGTTLTAILWDGSRIGVAQVGDSRGYRLRDGPAAVHADQTFVQSLVNEGRLTQQEAEHHPQRSLPPAGARRPQRRRARRAVAQPQAGDRYLLCSDGLSDYVSTEAIHRRCRPETPSSLPTRWSPARSDQGAPDNVTVIVADVLEEGTEVRRAAAPVARRRGPRGSGRAPAVGRTTTPARSPRSRRMPRRARAVRRHAAHEPHGRAFWLVPLIIAVVLALVAGVGFWRWSQNQWYIGVHDGASRSIRASRWTPRSSTSIASSERTDLMIDGLPEFEHDQVSGGIPAEDRAAAEQTVQRLRDAAALCITAPSTEGCPS